MRTTPVERLAHVGRLVLLVGAVLACATLGVWTLDQEWVEDLGAQLIDDHIAAARDRDVRLRSMSRKESAPVVALAAEQAAALAEIRPGERMEIERRRALEFLTRHRAILGDTEGSLEAAREWAEFDPRNVVAVLEYGRQLVERPDGLAEAEQLLGDLFVRLPGERKVAQAWCDLLMDQGRFIEAAEAAEVCDRQARPNLWRFRWKRWAEASQAFQAVISPRLDADGNLLVEATIEGPLLWMSIEFPPGGWCTLVDPVLSIQRKRTEDSLVLADLDDISIINLEHSGGSFTQAGGLGSRIELNVEGLGRDPKPTLRLRAKLLRPPSGGLLAIAYHPRLGEAVEALESGGHDAALAVVRQARVAGLAHGQAQLYWRKRKGGFTKANSSLVPLGGTMRDGELRFDVAFPVGERVRQVRLDLPEGTDVRYDLEELEIVPEQGAPVVLRFEDLAFDRTHSVEGDGAAYTVTGPDPWLAFEFPDPVVKIARVHLRGSAR